MSVLQPYKHQRAALRVIRRERDADGNKALVVMASGLGKTVVAALDVRSFLRIHPGCRVLYLCHQNDILEQARGIFASVLPKSLTTGYFHGSEKDIHEVDCLFASFQSMHRGRALFDPEEFSYVVVDESHHVEAPTYRPTINYFSPLFMLSITATPDRMDQRDIREHLGEEVFSLPLEEALAKDLLTPVDYRVVTDDWSYRKLVDTPVGRLSISQLNRTIFVKRRDEEIVRILQGKLNEVENPRVVIFCPSIRYANHLSTLIAGSLPIHTRLAASLQIDRLKDFREGRLNTVLTVDKFNEGIDVPDANVIVFMRSTASRTIFFQQLGRGLRKLPSKDHVLVLDFVANCERLVMLHELARKTNQLKIQTGVPGEDPVEVEGAAHFNFNEIVRDVLEVIEAIKVGYSREVLICQLRSLANSLQRTPNEVDIVEAAKRGECATYTTMRRYFGTLREALEESGLLPVFPDDVLLDALVQIASQKGTNRLSREDVVRAYRQGFCPPYTVFVRRFGSIYAAFKQAGLRSKIQSYSPEELISQLKQAVSARAITSLNTSIAEQLHESGDIAPTDAYKRHFGGLQRAAEVANIPWGGMKYYSEEQALEYLRELAKLNGGVAPLLQEVIDRSKEGLGPGTSVYMNRWGSFTKALKAAGLQPWDVTDEQLIGELRQLQEEKGGKLTSREVRQLAQSGKLSRSEVTYARRFGSLANACIKAGWRPLDDESILRALRIAEKEAGTPLKGEDVDRLSREGKVPFGAATYGRRFGGFLRARELAGLVITDEQIIAQLRELHSKEGKITTESVTEAYRRGECVNLSTIYRRFGTFTGAIELAGLAKVEITNEQLLEHLKNAEQQLGKYLTNRLVLKLAKEEKLPSLYWYEKRFGNLQTARKAAGLA